MPGRGANGPPGSGPGSNSARGSVGRGRGFAAKAKAGDTRKMGGVTLVAVNRDGGIAWEAVDPPASVACRETQRHAERDEARWLLQQEQQVKDARTLEARELQRRELGLLFPPAAGRPRAASVELGGGDARGARAPTTVSGGAPADDGARR